MGGSFITESESVVSRELEERLRFETLIAHISSRFVKLPAERVDAELVDSQRAICECLGMDHSTLWQTSDEEPVRLILTHSYRDPDLSPTPDYIGASQSLPWAYSRIMAHQNNFIPDIDHAPPEAARCQ